MDKNELKKLIEEVPLESIDGNDIKDLFECLAKLVMKDMRVHKCDMFSKKQLNRLSKQRLTVRRISTDRRDRVTTVVVSASVVFDKKRIFLYNISQITEVKSDRGRTYILRMLESDHSFFLPSHFVDRLQERMNLDHTFRFQTIDGWIGENFNSFKVFEKNGDLSLYSENGVGLGFGFSVAGPEILDYHRGSHKISYLSTFVSNGMLRPDQIADREKAIDVKIKNSAGVATPYSQIKGAIRELTAVGDIKVRAL